MNMVEEVVLSTGDPCGTSALSRLLEQSSAGALCFRTLFFGYALGFLCRPEITVLSWSEGPVSLLSEGARSC
jgi:hypothetical protein